MFLFTMSQMLSDNSAIAIVNIMTASSISDRWRSTKNTIYVKDANISNIPILLGIYPDF